MATPARGIAVQGVDDEVLIIAPACHSGSSGTLVTGSGVVTMACGDGFVLSGSGGSGGGSGGGLVASRRVQAGQDYCAMHSSDSESESDSEGGGWGAGGGVDMDMRCVACGIGSYRNSTHSLSNGGGSSLVLGTMPAC